MEALTKQAKWANTKSKDLFFSALKEELRKPQSRMTWQDFSETIIHFLSRCTQKLRRGQNLLTHLDFDNSHSRLTDSPLARSHETNSASR